jgi:hypothetical protein
VKSVKDFRYVEKTSAECNEDSYLAILHLSKVELHCRIFDTECNEDSYLVILHLSRVELHCKLQEKLHRVTWPALFTRSHASEDENRTRNHSKTCMCKRAFTPLVFLAMLYCAKLCRICVKVKNT